MIWIDIVILCIILISTVISLMRGFVAESMSLAGWIFSVVIAWYLSGRFASFFHSSIANEQLRVMVAFLILLVISLLMFGIVNFFAVKLVQRSGLTNTDRSIGLVFGLLRGVLLVILLTGLMWTFIPQSTIWRQSMLLPHFQATAVWLIDVIS